MLGILYPDRCLFCKTLLPEESKRPLCSLCSDNLVITGSICPVCEKRSVKFPACDCLPYYYPLKGLFALTYYEEKWRTLIHDFKYRGKRSAARPLGQWLGREIRRHDYCRPSLVIPVPLHKRRLQERGYNQSALLARQVAKVLEVPFLDLLERDRDTMSQTTINRAQRRENIHGAFSCNIIPEPGTLILLVDDIFSTGSTMREAASVLHSMGARVYGTVIAYNRRLRY